ncbi:DUF5017 domain-containing protein (plasmid) [Spirosoma sp. SC4-14]|uniref:DUF5017 domain-containing protein n=1 Tax=Spirosoma sp. SC4-14 TaxID=3128900 RepID=UPI0030CFCBE7
MNKYNISLSSMALLLASLTACRQTDVDAPSFDVSTTKTTVKAGETVPFTFTGGNPDQLVFYSGEIGKRYENRSRTSLAGVDKLVFQSAMQQGVLASQDSLRLLVSTNLKSYDANGIASATWTDITARNTKWPKALSTSYTTSDSIDLTSFNTADSVAIAFRFLGKKDIANPQRKWQIQNLTLTNKVADGTQTPLLSTFANTGWVQLSIKNQATAWDVGTANVSAATSVSNTSGKVIRSSYPITFDPGTTVGVDDNDDWLITSKVNPKTVKPDVGVVIKNTANNALYTYSYAFKTAGTYTVTFIAQNSNVNDRKDVVRQVQITVTP